MTATVLFKIAAYTGERKYYKRANASLMPMQNPMSKYPTAFGQWLQALSFALGNPKEIAILGDPQESDTQTLLAETQQPYHPHQVVAVGRPGQYSVIPLLSGRSQVDGRATVHVCRNFVCHLPITDSDLLRTHLMATEL